MFVIAVTQKFNFFLFRNDTALVTYNETQSYRKFLFHWWVKASKLFFNKKLRNNTTIKHRLTFTLRAIFLTVKSVQRYTCSIEIEHEY